MKLSNGSSSKDDPVFLGLRSRILLPRCKMIRIDKGESRIVLKYDASFIDDSKDPTRKQQVFLCKIENVLKSIEIFKY